MPTTHDKFFFRSSGPEPRILRDPAFIGLHLPAGGGLLAVAAWPGEVPQVFQATSGGYVAQAIAAWVGAQGPVRGVVLAAGPWQRDVDQGAAALWALVYLALAASGIPVWVLDPALAVPYEGRMRERYPGQPEAVRALLGLMTALEEGRV
jgi:hypothetical protein